MRKGNQRTAVRVAGWSLALAAVLAACSGDDSPAAAEVGPLDGAPTEEHGWHGIANDLVPVGGSYQFGGIPLCTNGPAVVIDSVQPVRMVGTVKVDRVGVRVRQANDTSETEGPGTLPASFQDPVGFTLTTPCAVGARPELAVQLSRTAAGSGLIEGLLIEYHVGPDPFELKLLVAFALCDPKVPLAEQTALDQCQ
jgi:hypothetical protein